MTLMLKDGFQEEPPPNRTRLPRRCFCPFGSQLTRSSFHPQVNVTPSTADDDEEEFQEASTTEDEEEEGGAPKRGGGGARPAAPAAGGWLLQGEGAGRKGQAGRQSAAVVYSPDGFSGLQTRCWVCWALLPSLHCSFLPLGRCLVLLY